MSGRDKRTVKWILVGVGGWFALTLVGDILARAAFGSQSMDDLASSIAAKIVEQTS